MLSRHTTDRRSAWRVWLGAITVPLMSAADNKKVLQDVFEQMAAGNTRAMRDVMSEDFRWEFPGVWSCSGAWEHKSEVLDGLLGPLMAQFTTYRSRAELILADEDRVVVQARATAQTTSGEAYP